MAIEVNFRRVQVTEVIRIQKMAQEIWRPYYSSIISMAQIEHMLAQMYSLDTLRQELAQGYCYEFICNPDKEVGYLAYHLVKDQLLKLEKLYLYDSVRGLGVGWRALKYVTHYAKEIGCTGVTLQVNKNNFLAQKAYERFGFKRVGELVFDVGNGFYMDDFIYTWKEA